MRLIPDADKDIKGKAGIVGENFFGNQELYELVTGSGWYGEKSYDYDGADEGKEFVNKKEVKEGGRCL